MNNRTTEELLAETKKSNIGVGPDRFFTELDEGMRAASNSIDDAILNDLDPQTGAFVDLGCAGGLRTQVFLEKFEQMYGRNMRVTGIDYNPEAVKVASQRGIYERVVQDDFLTLENIEDESFDAGMCVAMTFQFLLGKMKQGMSTFARIMKLHGNLYMTVYYRAGDEGKIVSFNKWSTIDRHFKIIQESEFIHMAKPDFKVDPLIKVPYGTHEKGYKVLYRLTKLPQQ